MLVPMGRRPIVGLVLVIGLLVGLVAVPQGRAAAAELPAWRGGLSLYRDGVFTTQRSWLWCTAAGVQIVRNIVDRKRDHTTSGQRRYFEWMRDRNRYDLPVTAGVDPAGWTAGLRHFVDDRYRLVASRTFDAALKSAVTRLRLTNLPVALTVSHGNHGWILTGFRATADPARTSTFRVTSVRVTGPLYGLQSKNGYDMAPNTKLTTAQLKRFFTPWKYAPKRMVWDGRYVSIQPVPKAVPKKAVPRAEPTATTQVTVAPAASPIASLGSPAIDTGDVVDATPTEPAVSQEPGQVAIAAPGTGSPPPDQAVEVAETRVQQPVALIAGSIVTVLLLGLLVAVPTVRWIRRRPSG